MNPAVGRREPALRSVARVARSARAEYAAPLSGRLQTRLQRSRPRAMRRHAARKGIRFAVLMTVDAIAAILAFSTCRVIGTDLLTVTGSGVVLPQRFPSLFFASVAAILSLLVSGGYARGSQAQGSVRLLRGASLAGALGAIATVHSSAAAPLVAIFGLWTALLWVSLACGRVVSERILISILAQARLAAPAILVGTEETDTVPGEEETPYSERYYQVDAVLDSKWFETAEPRLAVDRLGAMIHERQIEAVIVPRQLAEQQMELLLDVCCTAGCEFLYSARAIEVAGVRPSIVWKGREPFFEFATPELEAQQLVVKRCLDVIGATVGLVILSPLFLIVALAVKLDSRGPVLFAQDRAGLGGRRFRMFKFRTMGVDADTEKPNLVGLNHSGDSRLFKIPNDPRITRVGRFLRRWSLDELPQIWNVFNGDMSLVGPRPFFESDLEDYEAHHFRRLGAKPGVTGLWQVSGRSHVVDFEEVVRLDREYIEHWSIWLDISILLRTIPAVFGRNGAY
jgi:exopolysaccharide biosynthesis polyprenyl glycosylphosphotransferase